MCISKKPLFANDILPVLCCEYQLYLSPLGCVCVCVVFHELGIQDHTDTHKVAHRNLHTVTTTINMAFTFPTTVNN